jgi:Domain of unknown function DUF29
MSGTDSLYERDFYEWSQENSRLLREGRVAEADLPNIAQEIEDMGISQRHAARSLLRQILEHLVKVKFSSQPRFSDCVDSWRKEVREFRRQLEDLLEDMPSLSRFVDDEISKIYPRARKDVIEDGFADARSIPRECPFSKREVLETDSSPEPD